MASAWVFGIIGAVILLFAFLNWRTKRTNRTPEEVATYIENFVNGTGGDWDWDDFVSCPITDDELDAIRSNCSQLEGDYPSCGKGWCNEEGLQVMLALAKNLREKSRHRDA